MLIETHSFKDKKIFFYQDIDKADIKILHKREKIDYELLEYVSDAKERARVDYDERAKVWTIIYNVPLGFSNPLFAPFGIICRENKIFVFLTSKTVFIKDAFINILENKPNDETDDDPDKLTTWILIFDVLYVLTTRYFDLINQANRQREELDQAMQETTKNKDIIELAELSKYFVVILTSLNADVVALKSMKLYEHRLNTEFKLTVPEQEHLDDVLVEAEQAQEMAQLYSDITDKMTNNYNNLINNNMNNIMKFLTIYSIVLTIPTIVTGFFGMNVDLPLANSPWSWVITIGLSIIGGVGIWALMKKKNLL